MAQRERWFQISHTAFAGLRVKIGSFRLGVGTDFDDLRTYVTAGIGLSSVQLQYQREGFVLPHHTDGPLHNYALSIVLRRPKQGELRFAPPRRKFLRNRVAFFDGGQQFHYVTRVEGGPRIVCILQRSSRDAIHP